MPGNAVAAIEFEYPAGDIVEKIPVMGNGDDGAGILLEKSFQPAHRFRIEVIGRFIEQQHVGLGEQQAAQGDAAYFATGQLADIGIPRR